MEHCPPLTFDENVKFLNILTHAEFTAAERRTSARSHFPSRLSCPPSCPEPGPPASPVPAAAEPVRNPHSSVPEGFTVNRV